MVESQNKKPYIVCHRRVFYIAEKQEEVVADKFENLGSIASKYAHRKARLILSENKDSVKYFETPLDLKPNQNREYRAFH